MDQLNAMRAFVRVVEVGTFTRAAELLDLPKPTVTKLIQQLEGHLHAQLLNRTTRRVTVTMDGEAHTFDSFECAIHALAPECAHCGCRVVGHGVEEEGEIYCCASCAKHEGGTNLRDRA